MQRAALAAGTPAYPMSGAGVECAAAGEPNMAAVQGGGAGGTPAAGRSALPCAADEVKCGRCRGAWGICPLRPTADATPATGGWGRGSQGWLGPGQPRTRAGEDPQDAPGRESVHTTTGALPHPASPRFTFTGDGHQRPLPVPPTTPSVPAFAGRVVCASVLRHRSAHPPQEVAPAVTAAPILPRPCAIPNGAFHALGFLQSRIDHRPTHLPAPSYHDDRRQLP